jgi:phosphate transport system substrate-binding protein
MLVAKPWKLLAIAVCCCALPGCDALDSVDIQGAGATFPAPLYKRWFLEYYHRHPDVRVNYQAIGSGAGIRQFTADLVEFGASDAAMSDKEIKEAEEKNPHRGRVLLLPMTAGSIAICYNVPGAPRDLKLSRKVYADIFLGNITEWNDPAIASLNPDAQLPDLSITVVRRSDGSGTTYAFTNHLSTASKDWKEKVGVGKSVTWPVGIGGKGNAGVAAWIDQTPGAIGYLEYGYADLLGLAMARLENKAGRYVAPSLESGLAALKGLEIPDNLRVWLPDPAGSEAYPIVTYTWILCYTNYADQPERAAALREVLNFCLTEGQNWSAELGYIPLPSEIAERARQAVEKIKP